MSLQLYGHPFSSYCWKALIALYEAGTPFRFRILEPVDALAGPEMKALWPIGKMPVLRDGDVTVMEATSIIEHLDLYHGGRLLPADPKAALDVRLMDRVFDNYVMTPMQKFVADKLRPEASRDPHGVAEARVLLDTAYAWLDQRLTGHTWATTDTFSLADCAAAPSLFYADWVHPIDATHIHLKTYRARLLERPSVVRAIDEARPYRHYFPLGAPDRD